jgi:hypothetical protein
MLRVGFTGVFLTFRSVRGWYTGDDEEVHLAECACGGGYCGRFYQ